MARAGTLRDEPKIHSSQNGDGREWNQGCAIAHLPPLMLPLSCVPHNLQLFVPHNNGYA